jgi:hypothetical protein
MCYDYINQALQAAINSLTNGGTIAVNAGTYGINGRITLGSGISIIGSTDTNGYPTSVINFSSPTGGNVIQASNQRDIVLKNIEFQVNYHDEYITSIQCSQDVRIVNVKIRNPWATGFGSSGNKNLIFDNCEVTVDTPRRGKGFSIGGSPHGIQDVGTTLLNCTASGFRLVEPDPAGHGVQLRHGEPFNECAPTCDNQSVCQASPCPGGWSLCVGTGPSANKRCGTCTGSIVPPPNRDFRVLGGSYHNNYDGLYLGDVTNATLVDVRAFNNEYFGVRVVPHTLATGETNIAIRGGVFWKNGNNSNTNPHFGPAGGIRVFGRDVAISGAQLEDNWPNNIILEQTHPLAWTTVHIVDNILAGSRTLSNCTNPPCQPYHIYLHPTQDPIAAWVMRNHFGPTLFSKYEGNTSWITEAASDFVASRTYVDGGGDDIADNSLKTFFESISVSPNDHIMFEVSGASSGNGAWCAERADWYKSQYLAFAPSSGLAMSGPWQKWSRSEGGAWSSPITQGFKNSYGSECLPGSTLAWCSEWDLGERFLAVMPANTGGDESYALGFSNGRNWKVTVRIAPDRRTACGF